MNSSDQGFIIFEAHDLVLSKAAIPFNTIVSLPLNAYVMFLILSRASPAQDYFFLNLAVNEALYCLLSLNFFGFIVPNRHQLLFLEIALFSCGLPFTGRPLFQCCICVEYYVGVVHPVFFLRCRPLRYRAFCCGVIWLITLASCFSCRYTITDYRSRYFFFIQDVFLVSVMVFCCVSVLWALKQTGPGEGGPERRGGNAVKKRAFNIILLNMVYTSVNTVSYIVSIPLQCCLSQQSINIAWEISTSFALFTSFTQPLFYLYRTAKLDCCRRT